MAAPTQTILCPRCVRRAAGPNDEPIPPLVVSRGRPAQGGYCAFVSEAGLRPWLRLDTPAAVIYDGPEPGRRWTEKGATIALAGPPVLLALVLAVLLTVLDLPALVPVAAALTVAVAAWLGVALRWRLESRPLDRAIDAAWSMLAPRLHEPAWSRADAAFLAALAQVSSGRGQPALRGPALQRAILLAEQADDVAPRPLAALCRLAIEDAVRAGGDPPLLVSQHLAPAFQGALPLSLAHHLLDRWKPPFWTATSRARLRVLVAAAAFEAGLDVHDLTEAGLAAPALGELLDLKDPGGLAKLRLLWTLRTSRPWGACGEAFTVFELAGHPRLVGPQLEQVPDLLLWHAGLDADPAEPPGSIGVCGRGVVFGGMVFAQPPATIEVRARKEWGGKGFELLAGPARFRYHSDPAEAAQRLERWSRYFFHEFQPQALALLARRSANPLRICEACQRIVTERTA